MKISLIPELSTGYSNNRDIKDVLLDNSAFFKSPEKAMPKVIALVTDYAADAKYIVGKRFFLDAVFDHQVQYSDIVKGVKWEITPKENFREKLVSARPDARTIRKEIIPLKAGKLTCKVEFTDAKKQKTEATFSVTVEEGKVSADSLRVVRIINMEYTNPDIVDEFEVEQEEEVKVYFDSIMENEKGFSIITSENITITTPFKLAADKLSGTFKFKCVAAGKGSVQVCTTGTPYVGFYVPVKILGPLELLSISGPLEVVKGQTVDCVLTFNNYLKGQVPAELKISLDNANVTEKSRAVAGKTVTITYTGATEGVTKVEAQLGDASPSKSCDITVQPEARNITAVTADKPEVKSGENLDVTVEFDEYPVRDKIKFTPSSDGSMTVKGKPVVKGKKANQEIIPNIPGKHKLNVSYDGKTAKDLDVTILGDMGDGTVKA